MGMQVPQFTTGDVNMSEHGGAWFEAAMVSTCEPLFDDCDSNYEVEDKLEAAEVITKKGMATDSESCALVVNFKSEAAVEGFIDRLNAYLVEKAKKLAEAKAF
jgi:hypothetical protein